MKTPAEVNLQTGGEQMAVGVDPSRDALQLAILAPHGMTTERFPLVPASLASIDALLGQGQRGKDRGRRRRHLRGDGAVALAPAGI